MSVEIARAKEQQITTQVCPECSAEGHDSDALFCKYCGARL
jgi:voltage-gated potassium channel